MSAPEVCDGTSAVGESRHRIPGASVGQPTEPCLAGPRPGRWQAALQSAIVWHACPAAGTIKTKASTV